MSRHLLVERALSIAHRRHRVLADKLWKGKALNWQTGVMEVGTAMKFLGVFPSANQQACRAAYSLCNIVGSSTHLTPGPALKKRLKHSYYRSSKLKQNALAGLDHPVVPEAPSVGSEHPKSNWTEATYLGAWEWVRQGSEGVVREWRDVGVAVNDVVELVKRARSGGDKLNREEYTGLLKVCLCIQDHHGNSPMGVLLDGMVADCGVDVTQEILLTSAFQMATSEEQIRVICQQLGRAARQRPGVFQGEQLRASLTADNDPKRLMNIFTQYLLSSRAPPTMDVFESMLSTCARSYNLQWALNVFNCMTKRHGIAPSREAYNTLTTLLSRRAFKGDKYVTKSICHRILADAEGAYSGRPPLWVYAEMAKPLVALMGQEGYGVMCGRCEDALDSDGVTNITERRLALRRVWRPSLYLSLIRGLVVRGERDTALFMLREMRGWGFTVNSKTYEHLLQLVSCRDHLEVYLTPLLEGIGRDLPPAMGILLQAPLVTALGKVCKTRPVSSDGDGNQTQHVAAVSSKLLGAALTSLTHDECLESLETIAAAMTAAADSDVSSEELRKRLHMSQ